ncbi:MAG: hypothetical protein KDA57_21120 [Planctomycetales bacterium]|nr:hypothetical protein [Planctomycetales bacterium]
MSLTELSALELLELLVQKKTTSVELTEAYLKEIAAQDKRVGAFLRVDTDAALQCAAQIDQRRFFF